jgi:asparagine synthase (glutamine-hydrolysing)
MLGLIGSTSKKEFLGEGLSFSNDEMKIYGLADKYEDSDYLISVSGVITDCVIEDESIEHVHKLIIRLYKQHEDDFFKYLDGTFFILFYDKKNESLLLCNNRHQTSNLYYHETDNGLMFSNSLLTISKLMDSRKVYMPSVLSFLSNGFTYSDKTQLDGVSKLLPAFRIKWKNSAVTLNNHWNEELSFERRKFDDLETHLDRYEKTYQSVLKNYLDNLNPKSVGCLLSGGHDTSFAVSQLSKVLKGPLKTFTITFPNWAFNEEEHAKAIAKKFNCEFTGIPFQSEDLDLIVEMISAVEEPVVGVALPLHVLSKEASKHVDVIVGGDGGDTVWGEYYPVAEFHRYIKNMSPLPRKLIHKTSKFLAKTTDWERFWELEHVSSLFAEEDYYDQFMRKLCTYRHFRDDYLKDLFDPKAYGAGEISRSILEIPFTKNNFREDLIEGKLYNAFYNYMGFSQTKLMKSCGIDFFMPTVQKPVLDFITTLPYEWVNGGNTFQRLTNNKSINRKFHKKALSRYLKRDEIYNRSFDIPWGRILRPREDVLLTLKENLIKRGWFKESALDKLWDEYMCQSSKKHEILELKNHGYRIFTLLSLEVWCQIFIDGKDTESFNGSLSDFLGS